MNILQIDVGNFQIKSEMARNVSFNLLSILSRNLKKNVFLFIDQ